MVRIHPDPPTQVLQGAVAQLGERLLCKQEVVGSIPSSSTSQVPVVSWQLTVKAAQRAAVLLATDYCQLKPIGCNASSAVGRQKR